MEKFKDKNFICKNCKITWTQKVPPYPFEIERNEYPISEWLCKDCSTGKKELKIWLPFRTMLLIKEDINGKI